MSKYEPGIRVAAVRSIDEKAVYLYGYGEYEGDFKFKDAEIPPVGLVSVLAEKAGITENPRIKLDSGQTIWGCECWWCPIEKLEEEYGALEKKEVDIDKDREKIQSGGMDEDEATNETA